jgi:hypothetical protein
VSSDIDPDELTDLEFAVAVDMDPIRLDKIRLDEFADVEVTETAVAVNISPITTKAIKAETLALCVSPLSF